MPEIIEAHSPPVHTESAVVVAMFPEVYVGKEYRRAVDLAGVPLGVHMPLGLTDCESGGNTIRSKADSRWRFANPLPSDLWM